MTGRFMVMTATGTTPPRHVHFTLEEAQNEALRLSKEHNTWCRILEIIGQVEMQEVPVTELKPVIHMYKQPTDDLPF